MELISFLGKLFGYTPEIANVISGELRSVSEAKRRPKIQQKIDKVKAASEVTTFFGIQKAKRSAHPVRLSNLKSKI